MCRYWDNILSPHSNYLLALKNDPNNPNKPNANITIINSAGGKPPRSPLPSTGRSVGCT